MVWGGISMRSQTDLVAIEGNLKCLRYIDERLELVVLMFFPFCKSTMLRTRTNLRLLSWQQHCTRWLASKITRHVAESNLFGNLLWQRVLRRTRPTRTLQAVATTLQKEWRQIRNSKLQDKSEAFEDSEMFWILTYAFETDFHRDFVVSCWVLVFFTNNRKTPSLWQIILTQKSNNTELHPRY